MKSFIALLVALFVSTSLLAVDPPLADMTVVDFDSFNASLTVDEGTANVVSISGNNVLELTAPAGRRVKVRLAPTSGYWDLSDYVNLALNLQNVGTEEAWVRILIKDRYNNSEDSFYRPNCSHNAWIQPSETRIFPAFMSRLASRSGNNPGYRALFPSMSGLPHAQALVWYGIDTSQIDEVILQLEPKDSAQTVRVDDLRGNRRAKPVALASNPTSSSSFFPFIDRYGQYMHEDWPGKVSADSDLTNAKVSEDADLTANPKPVVYNEYGGWANGPTLPATGHFYTIKLDGKWWFVDPVGKLFWSLGANSLGLSEGHTNLVGKEHFYADLPSRQESQYFTYSHQNQTVDYFNSYYPALEIKYGLNFESSYNEHVLQRVQSWGLNTLGAWSNARLNQPAALKTPYTQIIWIPGKTIAPITKLDDPFDSGFRDAVVQAIGWAGTAKDDPYCIGFFDNNEITWGDDPEQEARDIMEDCGSGVATKVAMVDFLEARYGTIGAANAAWGSSYSSFNNLLPALGNGQFNWSGAAVDMKDFYAHLADTYYSEFRAAMKSVAPNKLYLGSRIYEGTMTNEVVSAAAAHCDVVSFNIYHKDLYEFQSVIPGEDPFFPEDKPFMIGEFNFGAVDRGMFWTGIEYAGDQRNRGEAYRHFVSSGLEDPRCIGAHWFAYKDGPLASRAADAENAAMGLVNSVDAPHSEMVAALRQVASEMYDYRYGHSLYASPQLLAEWQFDESAGSISGAVDTVAGATWNDDPDWTLNGSGQAEFSGLVNTQYANQFTPVGGAVFMRVDFAPWDFDSDKQLQVGFSLDSTNFYLRLRARASNPFFDIASLANQYIPAVSTTGMSIIVGVDLNTDKYSLWLDSDRTGNYTQLASNQSIGSATSVNAPYIRVTQFNGSNPIGIDTLIYGTSYDDMVAYGMSPYAIWRSSFGLPTSAVDSDSDGFENLEEFVFGGDPINASSGIYPIQFNDAGSEFQLVYPRRSGSGMVYLLQTSTDLQNWSEPSYSSFIVPNGFGTGLDAIIVQIPQDGSQQFLRIEVQEQ